MIMVKFCLISGKVVGINHKTFNFIIIEHAHLFTDSVSELELC